MRVKAFRPGIVPLCLTLAVLLLTLNLGAWQLRRASEKESLLQSWAAWRTKEPVALNEAILAFDQGKHVKTAMAGEWQDAPLIVWQNRSFGEQKGIQIFQWFKTSAGYVLVDRGWTHELVNAASGDTELIGVIREVPSAWRKPILPPLKDGVLALPVIDIAVLKETLTQGAHVAPYTLQLSAESPHALQAMAERHAVMPERHRGYAVTWFSLSAVIVLLFLKWSFRKEKTHE